MTVSHRMQFVMQVTAASLCCLLVFGATSAQDAAPPWSYQGDSGPAHWGELSDQYALCSAGQAQSPIDITAPTVSDLPDIQFNYQPSVLTVENNGFSVQVDYDKGSNIVFDGKTYQLEKFYFHDPSEHKINGKAYPMEMQLVHRDAEGDIAVVSVLMTKAASDNPKFLSLWRVMGRLKSAPWTVVGISINAADLLPKDHSYYTYEGSLTTPPCTEGVRWIVLQNTISHIGYQIDWFRTLFGQNARPVQPLNDRAVSTVSASASGN